MLFSSALFLSFSWLVQGTVIPKEARSSVASSYKSSMYYTNWATYDDHNPQDLKPEEYTHLNYAFANVNNVTGEVFLSDEWADLELKFPTDPEEEPGNNVYGLLKQLFLLKKHNRNLKTLLSIGGWSYRENFKVPASTEEGRKKFAESSLKLVKDLGFDGVDIDWEYPENESQADDCVLLMKAIREEFDGYTAEKADGKKFLITYASPAGADNYNTMKLAEMSEYLDFWNLMAYDFSGDWDPVAAHASNVYKSTDTPDATPFASDEVVDGYVAAGVDVGMIVLGMPLYGTRFANTDGPGTPFDNSKRSAAEVIELPELIASYSYDKAERVMISYDTPKIAGMKGEYIVEKGLGGGMWWDSSTDSDDPTKSLVTAVINKLGGTDGLEQSENQLDYPDSVYDNLKAGFPDE